MAKHLSVSQVQRIVGIVDGWKSGTKITWDALVRQIRLDMEIWTTRQTVARHEEVNVAFSSRKAGLRKEVDGGCDDRVLAQRLRRETAESARLREQNEVYRERLARWQYNAYKHGLKEQDLEEPLPEIDRECSG